MKEEDVEIAIKVLYTCTLISNGSSDTKIQFIPWNTKLKKGLLWHIHVHVYINKKSGGQSFLFVSLIQFMNLPYHIHVVASVITWSNFTFRL